MIIIHNTLIVVVLIIFNTIAGMEDQNSTDILFYVPLKPFSITSFIEDDLNDSIKTSSKEINLNNKTFEFNGYSGKVTIKEKEGDEIIQFTASENRYFLGKKLNASEKESGIEKLTKIVSVVDEFLKKQKINNSELLSQLSNYECKSQRITNYLYGFGLATVSAFLFYLYKKNEIPILPTGCFFGLSVLGMGYLFACRKNADLKIHTLENKMVTVMKNPVIRIIEEL